MRYDSQVGNPMYTPGNAPANMSSLTNPDAISPTLGMDNRTQYNPGIKPSGAPVNFNPKAQANMTGMFGMPSTGTYDRTMNTVIDASTMEKPTY